MMSQLTEVQIMKRSILAVAVAALCAMPSTSSAQGLGILVGPSYGTVPNSSSASLHANSGFAFGLSAQSGGTLGFGINALYAQRGFTSTDPLAAPGTSQKLSYIDVPVYLRVAIHTPVVVPFALAGPQVSFELNCASNGGPCPSGRQQQTFDGIGAIGVRFPMLAGLSIQGRYIYSLQSLKYGVVGNQSNYNQRSFMLLAGIGF
jgi:outer membrane protein with beta-barrel domain